MNRNNPKIQLARAYPGLEKTDSRKGKTFRGEIETEQGRRPAFIKMLSAENLLVEALCVTIAKLVNLPVLPAFYVDIEGAPNPYDLAFGLAEDPVPLRRGRGYENDELLLNWPDAVPCAVFDEWIGNRDRHFGNVLFGADNVFWMIDHDEALPNHLSPETYAGTSLLIRLAESHDNYFGKRKLEQQANGIAEQYRNLDWDLVADSVRPDILKFHAGLLRGHISFLQKRAEVLTELINEGLGLKQRELPFHFPANFPETKSIQESKKEQ